MKQPPRLSLFDWLFWSAFWLALIAIPALALALYIFNQERWAVL
jgi:hypothetical protein